MKVTRSGDDNPGSDVEVHGACVRVVNIRGFGFQIEGSEFRI